MDTQSLHPTTKNTQTTPLPHAPPALPRRSSLEPTPTGTANGGNVNDNVVKDDTSGQQQSSRRGQAVLATGEHVDIHGNNRDDKHNGDASEDSMREGPLPLAHMHLPPPQSSPNSSLLPHLVAPPTSIVSLLSPAPVAGPYNPVPLANQGPVASMPILNVSQENTPDDRARDSPAGPVPSHHASLSPPPSVVSPPPPSTTFMTTTVASPPRPPPVELLDRSRAFSMPVSPTSLPTSPVSSTSLTPNHSQRAPPPLPQRARHNTHSTMTPNSPTISQEPTTTQEPHQPPQHTSSPGHNPYATPLFKLLAEDAAAKKNAKSSSNNEQAHDSVLARDRAPIEPMLASPTTAPPSTTSGQLPTVPLSRPATTPTVTTSTTPSSTSSTRLPTTIANEPSDVDKEGLRQLQKQIEEYQREIREDEHQLTPSQATHQSQISPLPSSSIAISANLEGHNVDADDSAMDFYENEPLPDAPRQTPTIQENTNPSTSITRHGDVESNINPIQPSINMPVLNALEEEPEANVSFGDDGDNNQEDFDDLLPDSSAPLSRRGGNLVVTSGMSTTSGSGSGGDTNIMGHSIAKLVNHTNASINSSSSSSNNGNTTQPSPGVGPILPIPSTSEYDQPSFLRNDKGDALNSFDDITFGTAHSMIQPTHPDDQHDIAPTDTTGVPTSNVFPNGPVRVHRRDRPDHPTNPVMTSVSHANPPPSTSSVLDASLSEDRNLDSFLASPSRPHDMPGETAQVDVKQDQNQNQAIEEEHEREERVTSLSYDQSNWDDVPPPQEPTPMQGVASPNVAGQTNLNPPPQTSSSSAHNLSHDGPNLNDSNILLDDSMDAFAGLAPTHRITNLPRNRFL